MDSDWEKLYSNSKSRHYYFNRATGETTWELPATKRAKLSETDGDGKEKGEGKESSKETGSKIVIKPETMPSKRDLWTEPALQVNEYMKGIYQSGKMTDRDGKEIKLASAVNPLEGKHIYNMVKENKFCNTLEVGLANGASCIFICQAHVDNGIGGKHIAIDPFQDIQWNDQAHTNLKNAGLGDKNIFKHIKLPGHVALPQLLAEITAGTRPKFDFIFIDGFHTFDYTLLDFFYADLLLKVNGVILLDDIRHPGVRDVVRYVESNYDHYVYEKTNPARDTMGTFIKTRDDHRTTGHPSQHKWGHHVGTFNI